METKTRTAFVLRFALALFVVATTMAVSCPQPVIPDTPDPVVDTKSAERKQLESAYVEGLYLKGDCVLSYDGAVFQRAVNPIRRNYRIQRDDQSHYLNIRYNDMLPQRVDDEVECEIHYKLADGESTTLIVKLVVLKTTDEYLWLWNEFQKVGMIVQRI
ncbi:MAG: hypothetical protein IJL93_06800 [Bacteroidales bacterium]|nr:hypothetical protein [Bacteroidales bacterium]